MLYGCARVRVQRGSVCGRAYGMLQATTLCDHDRYNQTGAAIVAIVFLSVFVVLLFGDGVLTWFALQKALTKDEREAELMKTITTKEAYLKELQESIKAARKDALHVYLSKDAPTTVPGVPLSLRDTVTAARPVGFRNGSFVRSPGLHGR